MKSLLQQAGIILGQKVLDVGFRDAAELQAIASLVGPMGHVLGIDIDSRHIETACDTLGKQPNISIKNGSVLDIPASEHSFDLILCKGILHEVRQLDRAFTEMTRVCNKDGFISIIDFQRHSRVKFELYRFMVRLKGRHCIDVHPGFTHEQLLKRLSQHQLEEVCYKPLPDKWRLGFYEVHPFLLKVRRKHADFGSITT